MYKMKFKNGKENGNLLHGNNWINPHRKRKRKRNVSTVRTPTESSPNTESVRIVRYRILLFRRIDGAERTTTRSAYRKIERKDEKEEDEKKYYEKYYEDFCLWKSRMWEVKKVVCAVPSRTMYMIWYDMI